MKKFLLLPALLLACTLVVPTAQASKSLLFNSPGVALSPTFVRYLSIVGRSLSSNALFTYESPVGNFTKWSVKLSVAPGAGASYTFELMKGSVSPPTTAAASSVASLAVSDTATSNVAAINIAVAQGDYFYIRVTPSSGTAPAAAQPYTCIDFDSTTAKQSCLWGGSGNLATDGSTQYCLGGPTATIEQAQIPMPCAGTIKNLWVSMSGTSGGAGKGWHFMVMKGAATTDLTCDLDNAASGYDNTHSVSVVKGDLITVRAISYGTPTARSPWIALTFEAETDGDFPLVYPAGSNTIRTDAVLRYSPLSGAALGVVADSQSYTQTDFYAKTFCFYLTGDPTNSGSYYDANLYTGTTSANVKNNASLARVSAGSIYGDTTPGSPVLIGSGYFAAWGLVSANTPVARGGALSICGNIPPTPTGISVVSGVPLPTVVSGVTTPSIVNGVIP